MDVGRWTLDVGRWTLDVGRWTLDVGRWTRISSLQRTLESSLNHDTFAGCQPALV
ncbi:MAG: hypothetical protein K6L73_05685 [Cellvibrionaceae bacterium]